MQTSLSIFQLIEDASPVAKGVLLVLLLASALSWLLILRRAFDLRRERRELADFERSFYAGTDLNRLYEQLGEQPAGVGRVFREGFGNYCRLLGLGVEPAVILEAVSGSLRLALSREGTRLNRYLVVLATISSASPYIGLFGTVWGIMGSFQAIGASAQATLATVAPWIAEALVATAAGLFAAIPAVIAYNALAKQVTDLQGRLGDVAEELHGLLLTHSHSRFQVPERKSA